MTSNSKKIMVLMKNGRMKEALLVLEESYIDPYVIALYAIPRLALVPLITLIAGLGLGGKTTIIVSIAIFPIIINKHCNHWKHLVGRGGRNCISMQMGKRSCVMGNLIF